MRLFALAPLVLAFAASGCSSPVVPQAADVVGNISVLDAANNTLGVRESQFVCVTGPCVSVTVRVTGKIFLQAPNGNLSEIAFTAIPVGASVSAWTKGRTGGPYPSQAEAFRVIVTLPVGVLMTAGIH